MSKTSSANLDWEAKIKHIRGCVDSKICVTISSIATSQLFKTFNCNQSTCFIWSCFKNKQTKNPPRQKNNIRSNALSFMADICFLLIVLVVSPYEHILFIFCRCYALGDIIKSRRAAHLRQTPPQLSLDRLRFISSKIGWHNSHNPKPQIKQQTLLELTQHGKTSPMLLSWHLPQVCCISG